MGFCLTCLLRNLSFQKTLRQKQCLYLLKERIYIRKFGSDIQKRYLQVLNDNKYAELRNRLATVPYFKLLDKEADRVHQDLCYENDERLDDVLNWCSKVFSYNVLKCEEISNSVLLKAYCTYGFNMEDTGWNQWDSKGWNTAVLLTWFVESTKSYMTIFEDVIDQSILRRGKLCWYKKSDVGHTAINDALLLQFGGFKLLQKHLASSDLYVHVLHDFLKVKREAVFAKSLEMMLNPKNQKPRFDKFTFEEYQTIAEYKTANFQYLLPVFLAMHLATGCSKKDFDFAKELCFKIGLSYQSQNDLFDCFETLECTGNNGSNIRKGKCTWFSVKFLEEASEPQKKQFLENYGVNDKDAADTVLELYEKTNLLAKFEEFEEQMSEEIITLAESFNDRRAYLFYDLFAEIGGKAK